MKYIKNKYYFVQYPFNVYIVINTEDSNEMIKGIPLSLLDKEKREYPLQNMCSFKSYREATQDEINLYLTIVKKEIIYEIY